MNFRHRQVALALSLTVAALAGAADCIGEVAVVYNDGATPLQLQVSLDGGAATPLTLEPGDSRPLFATSSAAISDPRNPAAPPQQVSPGLAYRVSRSGPGESLNLHRMSLGGGEPAAWPEATPNALHLIGPAEITVKLLVDDNERRPREVWEPLIRQRVAEASQALSAHTGIGLRVVAVDTWNSNDNEQDFQRSLAEFEREVNPAPAQVAIGFCSQYVLARGRVHLGGTRGPLHPHVMIKEWAPNVLETERVVLLTHEMGHYFGAAHSEAPHSVMRPVIGKSVQRMAGARLQFDAPNTLLMSMLGEQICTRAVENIGEVEPDVRRRMAEVYSAMNRRLPSDPAAQQLQGMVQSMGHRETLSDASRVLSEIVRVAGLLKHYRDQQQQGELSPAAAKLLAANETGEQLLQTYVRQAARAVQRLRSNNPEQALLLALAVAMDDVESLSSDPQQRPLVGAIEGVNDLEKRQEVMQTPSLQQRRDAAREFFAAAFHVLTQGSSHARSTLSVRNGCYVEGQPDPQLLAANRAGLVFAHALLGGAITVEDVAKRFTPDAAFPPADELGSLSGDDPQLRGDAELAAELMRLERFYSQAPLYRSAATPIP